MDINNRVSFSVRETSELTGISSKTLYRKLDQIEHIRLGTKILIKRQFIDNLIGNEQAGETV